MSDDLSNLKLRVFISSVQKELTKERMEMKVLLTADPFLVRHTVPCLFEQYPAPLRPDKKAYLQLLEKCQIYVLILGSEYGSNRGLSATQLEYDFAQERKLPTLVCVKGDSDFVRESKEEAFFQQIRKEGHTYSRFRNLEELHANVRERLIEHVKATYEISPTKEEKEIGESSATLASVFERQEIATRESADLKSSLVAELTGIIDPEQRKRLTAEQRAQLLLQRGYLWFQSASQTARPTAAGWLIFGNNPASLFPQARVQLDVYPGASTEGEATLTETIRDNLPSAIARTVALILANTRKTPRVVGLKRREIPEYPEIALREAVVNALAHRDYEDASGHVVVEIFSERIVVTNPGLPVGHPSLKRLSSGVLRSRSRNPLISQGLVFLGLMEERGTGIRRMRRSMLEHGLDTPVFAFDGNDFVLTLPGAADLSRIKAPTADESTLVERSRLSARQIAIVQHVVLHGSITNREVQEQFHIVRDTAFRDLTLLVEGKIFRQVGRGRSTHYVAAE